MCNNKFKCTNCNYENELNIPSRPKSLKLAQQRYYKKNKEKIDKYRLEYAKEYGKKEFICECGKIIAYHSKTKHLLSKKHLKYKENKENSENEENLLKLEFKNLNIKNTLKKIV